MNHPGNRWIIGSTVGSSLIIAALLGLKAFPDVPRGTWPAGFGPAGYNRSDQELLSRASRAFNEIARRASPAVVAISTIRSAGPHPPTGMAFPFGAGPEGPDSF